MKKLDQLIPSALTAAEENLLTSGKKIPSEYKGYIASFGAMVRSAGLKPAIAFYESKSSGAAQDRGKLMGAILKIVTSHNSKADRHYTTLMDYVLQNDHTKTRRDILNAATALKLAIRTFDQEERKNVSP